MSAITERARTMPRFAMTYVAYWPADGVLKVGRAWRFSRIAMLGTSGAMVLVLARGTDSTWERNALALLRTWFPRAFETPDQARRLLFKGRGYTECFRVAEHHLTLAVDLCFEGFAKGSDQQHDHLTTTPAAHDHPGAPDRPRPAASAADDSVDGDGAVDGGGRLRWDGGGADVGDGGVLSGRGGAARDDRGAVARAVGDGLPDAVHGAGGGLARAGASVVDAAADGDVAAASWRLAVGSGGLRKVHGCGGSGRGGARAGAGRERMAGERAVGERAGAGASGAGGGAGRGLAVVARGGRTRGASAGAAAAAGCSADRLPGAPVRPLRELRSLRHGEEAARPLGGAAQARHRDGGLRRGAAGDLRWADVRRRGAAAVRRRERVG